MLYARYMFDNVRKILDAKLILGMPMLIWDVPLVGDPSTRTWTWCCSSSCVLFRVKEAMAVLKSAVLWRKPFSIITSLLDTD